MAYVIIRQDAGGDLLNRTRGLELWRAEEWDEPFTPVARFDGNISPALAGQIAGKLNDND